MYPSTGRRERRGRLAAACVAAALGGCAAAVLPAGPALASPVTFTATSSDATLAPGATATFPDYQPPKPPGNLRSAGIVDGLLRLRWDPGYDNVAVTGYAVYLGTRLLATVTATQYATYPPPPVAGVTYRVRAVDAAGNPSPYATLTLGRTVDPPPAPAPPTGLRLSPGVDRTTVTWDAPADPLAVAGYDVSVDGFDAGATSAGHLTVLATGFGLIKASVRAFDARGVRSAPAETSLVLDPLPGVEFRPPTAPADVRGRATPTTVTFGWTASTDDTGVLCYETYQDGRLVFVVPGTSITVPRTRPYGDFTISVRAVDRWGNRSPLVSGGFSVDPPPPAEP
jgi:hypothetical protein